MDSLSKKKSLQKGSGRDELHIFRKEEGDQCGLSGVFIELEENEEEKSKFDSRIRFGERSESS